MMPTWLIGKASLWCLMKKRDRWSSLVTHNGNAVQHPCPVPGLDTSGANGKLSYPVLQETIPHRSMESPPTLSC